MIEFNGELSDNCKLYLVKDLTRFNYFFAPMITVLLSIPIILAGIFWNSWILIFLIGTIFIGISFAIPRLNPQTKTVDLNLPTKIIIHNEIIEREGKGNHNYAIRDIANVKKVIDLGEWYHFIFYFGYKDSFFVCQKNLLKKGTIEEFEAIFQGKIAHGDGVH